MKKISFKEMITMVTFLVLLTQCSLFDPGDLRTMVFESGGEITVNSTAVEPGKLNLSNYQQMTVRCSVQSSSTILSVTASCPGLWEGTNSLNPDGSRKNWELTVFVAPEEVTNHTIYLTVVNDKGKMLSRELEIGVAAAGTVVYLSTDGDDNYSGMFKEAPVRTFEKALWVAWVRQINTLHVSGGRYTNIYSRYNVNLLLENKTNMVIQGGWDSTFTTQDAQQYPTIIDKGNNPSSGIIVSGSSNILIRDLTVKGKEVDAGLLNSFSPRGGGLYVQNSDLDLVNCSLVSNWAKEGGGLYAINSTLQLTQLTCIGNYADNLAGGIVSLDSSIDIVSSLVSNSSVAGGVSAGNSQIVITNSVISGNSGGGIRLSGCAAPQIIGSDISGNYAPANGGGIYLSNTQNALLQNNHINNNSSSIIGVTDSLGGGLYVIHSDMSLLSNTLEGNWGESGGGIALWESSNCIISNNFFRYNVPSSSAGGAIYLMSADVDIIGNMMTENGANPWSGNGDEGGALYIRNSSPNIFENIIINNFISGKGVIYIYTGSPIFSRNVVTNNYGYAVTGYLFNVSFHLYSCTPSFISNTLGAYDFSMYPSYMFYEGSDISSHTLEYNIFLTNTMDYLYYESSPAMHVTNSGYWTNINNTTSLNTTAGSTNNRATNM